MKGSMRQWLVTLGVLIAMGDPLYWEVNAPDAATAASCNWHLREGGVQVVPQLTGVTCVATANLTGVFTCHAALPWGVLSLGDHTLTLTESASGFSESDASNPLTITIIQPKAAQPRNLRTTAQ